MARYYNLTDETFKRLVIDAGKVIKNYTTGSPVDLGCTRGGSTFTIETEMKKMGFDGAKGDVKGDKRITNVKATMVVNFIEHSADLIKSVLPGSSSAAYPASPATKTHDRITRALQVGDSDYWTDITILGEVSGAETPVQLTLLNPLSTGNFEMAFTDNEEAGCTLTMTGHFDVDDLETEPWIIDFPVIPA